MDIYTSDEFQKKANKQALILARTRYNELIAPFVKDSSSRFEYAKNDIEKIVLAAVEQFDADADYVRSNLRAVIAENWQDDTIYSSRNPQLASEIVEAIHSSDPGDLQNILDSGEGQFGPDDYYVTDLDNGIINTPQGEFQFEPDYLTPGKPVDDFLRNLIEQSLPEPFYPDFPGQTEDRQFRFDDPNRPPFGSEEWNYDEIKRERRNSKKAADSDNKRTMEKGLGVDGEAVKEDLTNAGKSYTGFGDGKGDAKDKGLGVDGGKGGEEATSEYKSESVNFDKNDAENKDAVEGFGGGPESPSSEIKDPSERPDESIEETDISYHNGPVLEKEIRGPSAGGPGKAHDLMEDTFKWTKVEDRLIVSTMESYSCGSDCASCNCGDSCGKDCPCKKKSLASIPKSEKNSDSQYKTYLSSEEGNKPTSGMKSAAARSLKWREEGHKGGTSIGLGRAHQIVNGENLSDSTVKRMHSFFARHAVDKNAPGFYSGPKFPSPGRVAWGLWGGDSGASWSKAKAAQMDKSSSLEKQTFAQIGQPITGYGPSNGDNPNDEANPLVGTKICPSCNTVNESDATQCANISCGKSLTNQTNPLTNQTLAATKTAELPGEPQGSVPNGAEMPMNNAPNPAMMGENVSDDNKSLQDPKALARITIANESAAKEFSQIDKLENAPEVKKLISQKYNLPEEYVDHHLVVEATFGDSIAINGQMKVEGIDTETLSEVHVDQQFIEEGDSLTEIKKGASVPLKLILKKIMKEENIDEITAMNSLKDAWVGGNPPLEMNVLVQGSLRYFLPIEAVGQQQTRSPFQQQQRPEDVMDQEYNQVSEQPTQ